LIIGLSTYGGVKLDEYYKFKRPYCTIVASLLGIGIALYVVIKDVITQSKNDSDSTNS